MCWWDVKPYSINQSLQLCELFTTYVLSSKVWRKFVSDGQSRAENEMKLPQHRFSSFKWCSQYVHPVYNENWTNKLPYLGGVSRWDLAVTIVLFTHWKFHIQAFNWYWKQLPWMTSSNSKMAVIILCHFIKFGSFGGQWHQSDWTYTHSVCSK